MRTQHREHLKAALFGGDKSWTDKVWDRRDLEHLLYGAERKKHLDRVLEARRLLGIDGVIEMRNGYTPKVNAAPLTPRLGELMGLSRKEIAERLA